MMTPLIDRRLVDKAIEAYVDWREACIWLDDAYLVWSRQRGSNADVTFGGYTAALDREERTAERYARVLNWVSMSSGALRRRVSPTAPSRRDGSVRAMRAARKRGGVGARTTRGRSWSAAAARAELRRTATTAGVRRRFAPHQLRHAHAVEMAREGVPLIVIQRQLGHSNLGITSIYL
jgi:integrase